MVVVDLAGSTPETEVDVFTGETLGALQAVTGVYGRGADGTGRVRFGAEAGQRYHLRVGSGQGVQGDVRLHLQVFSADPAPEVVEEPGDVRVMERRDEAVMGVRGLSATAVSYRWWHDGEELAGATNAELRLPGVGLDQAGWYTVEACNAGGCGWTNWRRLGHGDETRR